jgi:phosphoglycolate phosphatase-like HAD superfamily hydrolase
LRKLAQLKNLNSREIIKQSGISIFKVPFLIRKVKAELNKEIEGLKPIIGIKEALTELKDQGNNLLIITSNSKIMLLHF